MWHVGLQGLVRALKDEDTTDMPMPDFEGSITLSGCLVSGRDYRS